MEFNERLRKLRIEKGMTQTEISQLLNITRPAYTCYETGKTEPNIKTLLLICDILEIDLQFLLKG